MEVNRNRIGPEPEPLKAKIADFPERSREAVLDMIDQLVMDSRVSPVISDTLPDLSAEERKGTIVELIEKGYLKIEFDEDEEEFHWVIWRDGAYHPL